jgi:flagellin-like protein
MKANRKFTAPCDDEAVSPVIAVILMVAITVVLAATVYVWVSGFGKSGSQAKTLSVTQSSCTATAGTAAVKFTIVSVSPNFAYSNLLVKDATNTAATFTVSNSGTITAGDSLKLDTAGTYTCADTLSFVDSAANSVVASIVLHA